MELGQNLWVGRCCDLIFLALGAGSGLLASSMGCKMRLRALMNLPRSKMETGKSPPGGGSMCAQVRVSVCGCVHVCMHTCACLCARVCTRVHVCAESAKLLPDSEKLVLVRNRPGSGLGCGSTAVMSPGHRGARDVTRALGDYEPVWDECVRGVRNLCSRPVRTEQRKEEPPQSKALTSDLTSLQRAKGLLPSSQNLPSEVSMTPQVATEEGAREPCGVRTASSSLFFLLPALQSVSA